MAETGTFLSRDPVESEPSYLYVRGNPVNWVDSTGKFPEYCRDMNTRETYAQCVLTYYGVEPNQVPPDTTRINGGRGCWQGPIPYKAPGYLEGVGGAFVALRQGSEVVYDFATMERHRFSFLGNNDGRNTQGGGGGNDSLNFGIGGSRYTGIIFGFTSETEEINPSAGIIEEYRGRFDYWSGGLSTEIWPRLPYGVGGGYIYFSSPDGLRWGYSSYLGLSASAIDVIPGAEVDIAVVNYEPIGSTPVSYATEGEKVKIGPLTADILSGVDSPIGIIIPMLTTISTPVYVDPIFSSRAVAISMAYYYAWIHDGIYVESTLGED